MLDYELTNTTSHAIDTQAIESGLAKAATALKLNDRFVSIEIVTPEQSQELNRSLRGKNEPTDIISISSQESEVGTQEVQESASGALEFILKHQKPIENTAPVIGQLVVCLDVVGKNAERAGQPVSRELEWVVEHGVYHLMGFHHEGDH